MVPRAVLGAILATAAALALVIAATMALTLRAGVAPVGERLAADAAATAAEVPGADPAGIRPVLAQSGWPARLLGPDGAVLAEVGAPALWQRGPTGWAERLATARSGSWELLHGTIEARATTPAGRTVVLRRGLGAGAAQGRMDAPPPVVALAALLALGAGAIAGLRARGLRRRITRVTTRADALATGRTPAPATRTEPPEWRRLVDDLDAAAVRAADLRAGVEGRFEALGAGLSPLPVPAAARTPTGARIRNEALERLVGALPVGDADAVETAVREGLAAGGASSRRIALADGRVMEAEAWPVPGGRLVAITERTEQERLAAVRRQVTGAAVRHLQSPVAEIQAVASDLLAEGPAAVGPSARRIQASADRMERTLGSLLRGTLHDPRARPLRREAIGPTGLLWGLGRAWDERLRPLGLRLETSVDEGMAELRTDPGLLEEILSELIANAAKFCPSGGVITVAAEGRADGGATLRVHDTGRGLAPDEVFHATIPFVRGRDAAAIPGAGLGLGVTAALAERLGGRLVVAPGPGGNAALELPPPPAEPPEPPGGEAAAATTLNGAAA